MRASSGTAPSRSCALAAVTATASSSPSVSTATCRLVPFTRLPASKPRSAAPTVSAARSDWESITAAVGSGAHSAGPAQPVVQRRKQSLVASAGRTGTRASNPGSPPTAPATWSRCRRCTASHRSSPADRSPRPTAPAPYPRLHRDQPDDRSPLTIREIRGIHPPALRTIRGVEQGVPLLDGVNNLELHRRPCLHARQHYTTRTRPHPHTTFG